MRQVVIVHGGAVADPSILDDLAEPAADGLRGAVRAAQDCLRAGAGPLAAAVAAVVRLEDMAPFNAGWGSALNAIGEIEMNASVPPGPVAAVRRARNPGALPAALRDRDVGLFLGGAATDAFAEQAGLQTREQEWLVTERRLRPYRERLRSVQVVRSLPAS